MPAEDAPDLEFALRDRCAAGSLLDLGDWANKGVPAELLYDFLTGGDAARGARSLKLRGARVVGPLDLEAATLRYLGQRTGWAAQSDVAPVDRLLDYGARMVADGHLHLRPRGPAPMSPRRHTL